MKAEFGIKAQSCYRAEYNASVKAFECHRD